MNVLKGFLYFCAAGFLLGGILPVYFAGVGLLTLLALAGGAALAYVTFRAAQKFNVQASVSQQVQFEQTYRQLAAKAGGAVAVDAMVHATGESKETVQAKMRELMGKGVCEMDFGPNGEMLFKLTPMDEARASLSGMREKH